MGQPIDARQTAKAIEEANQQVGALCYRVSDKGRLRVLMVTSRRTGRWIIPKGWPMVGKTASEAAAQEAWEEAGVRGVAEETSIGAFTYTKLRGPGDGCLLCRVTVFPLAVQHLADRFPEKNQRDRSWMSPAEAAKQVAEKGLAELLKAFAPEPR
ncbi:NUDIX hydrolase [Tritonibacter horizontis]|uniref:NUDIX domain protein n=1 Tax=Tritonibacter horizontis TaxID=1768241 RepID=A0A132C051_9RHOB|nr:NUDIX hydrolase [Tritonibacter horizontis]KUP93953.1 NUDIX domain protein [Tritonibacter horizontis]